MSATGSAPLDALLNVGSVRLLSLRTMELWGEAVGRHLPRGSVVTLAGDLGTGKTTLARALCRGLGVVDESAVTSPTFAIVQQYPTSSGSVTHADLYRLDRDSELDALGWDEIVDSAETLIVEWPDRSSRPWPARRIHIELAHPNGEQLERELHVTTG